MHFWCLDINARQIQFYTFQLVIFTDGGVLNILKKLVRPDEYV